MAKTPIEIVSNKLDQSGYLIIPTYQVGSLMHSKDANGKIRDDAITLGITDINEMVYADKVQILLEAE